MSIDPNRVVGVVKWYHRDEDYGFIYTVQPNGRIMEVHFHRSQFKIGANLQPGQVVECYLTRSRKGLRAVDLVILRDSTFTATPDILRMQEELARWQQEFESKRKAVSMQTPDL